MLPVFNGTSMIAFFLKVSLAVLPLIELLAGAAGDQPHGFGNDVPTSIVGHKQLNRIGSDHVIQDLQTVSLPCLIEPLEPSVSIF